MNLLTTQPIAIGSDHAGFEYKQQLLTWLESQAVPCQDMGTFSSNSADYPDFAHAVAQQIEQGKSQYGILLCGSGNGVAITANKHRTIRAALCWNDELASLARQHNDANILCLPTRFVPFSLCQSMANAFLTTPFEGGRHAKRVEKI